MAYKGHQFTFRQVFQPSDGMASNGKGELVKRLVLNGPTIAIDDFFKELEESLI